MSKQSLMQSTITSRSAAPVARAMKLMPFVHYMQKKGLTINRKTKSGHHVMRRTIGNVELSSKLVLRGIKTTIVHSIFNSDDNNDQGIGDVIEKFVDIEDRTWEMVMRLVRRDLELLHRNLATDNFTDVSEVFGTEKEPTAVLTRLKAYLEKFDHVVWRDAAQRNQHQSERGSLREMAIEIESHFEDMKTSDGHFRLYTDAQVEALKSSQGTAIGVVSTMLEGIITACEVLSILVTNDPEYAEHSVEAKEAIVANMTNRVFANVLLAFRSNQHDKLVFENNQYNHQEFEAAADKDKSAMHKLRTFKRLCQQREKELRMLFFINNKKGNNKTPTSPNGSTAGNSQRGASINTMSNVPRAQTLVASNRHYPRQPRTGSVAEALKNGYLSMERGQTNDVGETTKKVCARLEPGKLNALVECRNNWTSLTDVLSELNCIGAGCDNQVLATVTAEQLNHLAIATASTYTADKEEYFRLTAAGAASTTPCTKDEFISSIKLKDGRMPFFDSGWVGFSPAMQKAIQMARATTKSAAQPPRQLRHLKTTLTNGQHRRSARGYHGNKPNEGGPSDRKKAFMERNKWALATNECIYHHTKRGCHKGDACQYNHSDNKPGMGSMGSLNNLNYQQSEEVVRQLTKNMRKMSDGRN